MNDRSSHFTRCRLTALASALALGSALVVAPALAAAASAAGPDTLTVQTVSGVSYLNGGIGAAEQAQMRREAHGWPLHVTFSEGKAGAFVADASLKIADKAGKTVFTLDGAGPMTYVRLSPGQYRVTADHKGRQLVREVRVGKTSANLYFRW